MAHISQGTVAERVSTALNLNVSAISRSGEVDVRVDGIERPDGFRVSVAAGLSFAFAELKLDNLAMNLVRAVDSCSREDWRQMFEVKNSFAELGMAVDVKLNVSEAVSDELMLPPSIEAISISSKAMIQERNPSEVAGDVATSVIATLLALLPIDDPANDGGELGIQFDADVEGARSRKEVNFYERSRANRAVAIAIHGTTCQVCDINFGDRYGELGVGYIEIHHLTPVSQMGAERVVDPAKELVPLCANCHRMAHRRSPPVSPSDLRLLLARFDG